MVSCLPILLATLALASATDYKLVWSDEFDGNSLDRSKWQYEVNCDGGGNNELQCYTDRPSNVQVRDGALVVTARLEDYSGKQYTSGRINTKHAAAWRYGKFEARAKLPDGIYTWPALWMMPRDAVYGGWAASGEIDIMENRGGKPRDHSSALHYGGSWPKNIYASSGFRNHSQDLTQDFHVYSAIWTPESIRFFVDGDNFHTISLKQSFNNAAAGSFPYNRDGQPWDQHFFFIINLAVGGAFFGGEAHSLTKAQANAWRRPSLMVDYVRVYQPKEGGDIPTPKPDPRPDPRPEPTKDNNDNGCAAGACGGAACCSGHCYNPKDHSCVKDQANGKPQLCPARMSACNGACFDGNHLKCNNGRLGPRLVA